ncbi:hypothetical protein JVU11DRAFT_7554 [Chiua virens]|nr:hypothetical protein JVU11DRAFT_7554 [Chiua virens]
MDFDKTSFSVDWFTPGDKYAPKRLSFPKSARISIDDIVSDSPLGFCFSPFDEVMPGPRSYSFADSLFERACGWSNSAPPSPLPTERDPSQMNDKDPKKCEESAADWPPLAHSAILSVAADWALCGAQLDVSCLDALDEQLLLSPVESFTEMCWVAAVQEDGPAPVDIVTRRNTRSRACSFKYDKERPFPAPLARDYPGSFERSRPLAAKISLPLEIFPHYLGSPASDSSKETLEDKPLAYILDTDLEARTILNPLPVQGPWRPSKKHDLTHMRSMVPLAPAPSLQAPPPPKSNRPLRVISDAYSTLVRARRS